MSTSSEEPAVPDRDRLIESHLPLVRAIARRYAGRGEALDDLVQVGSVALVAASDRFDPGRGVAFASFATPAVEGAIRRHLGDRTTPMRIPRELQRLSGQVERRRTQLAASLGREPTVDELAAALGAERQDVEQALAAARARNSAPESADVTQVAGDYEFRPSTDDRLLLALAARVLDERQRRIVLLRFHADMTEREIAREVGISQAQVSRLLSGALAKLRAELETHGSGDISESGEIYAGGEDRSRQEIVQRASKIPRRRAAGSRIGAVGVSQQKAEPAPGEASPKKQRPKRRAGSSASGRFLVRMPSELHQELALAAERDDVSLNRYVTEALAASVGGDATSGGGSASVGAATSPGGSASALGAASAVATEDRPPRPQASRAADNDAAGTATAPRRSFKMLLAANVIVMLVAAAAAIVLVTLALERGI